MAQLVLGGRYRLHEVLGRGGMATVWHAEDLHLQRAVAVKVLSPAVLAVPGMRERLGREARILARLAHPNVVAVHDFDVESDTAYVVLELVEGPSLGALLARGPLPVVEQAIGIAIQVCDALAAAHAAGVQHRDIKPANLIVTPDGVVKVCDFGIARSEGSTLNDLTAISGTSEYVAPERASGEVGDARADLYALGCVLYAMLSGSPPFTGRTPVAVLRRHLNDEPEPLSDLRDDVPAGLDRLVLDLLAKDPARRPQSAEAVRQRLTAMAPAPASAPTAGLTVAVPVIDLTAEVDERPAEEPTTRLGPGHRRADAGGPGLRWALVALAVLVVLGGLLAILPTLAGSPGGKPDGRSAEAAGSPADEPSATGEPSADASPAEPSAPPTEASPTAPAPSAAAGRRPTLADQFDNLQAVITQQVNAGQLDPRAAADLRDRLEEVGRRLSRGQAEVASNRLAKLRQDLADLLHDGKLSNSGFQVVTAALDRFAGSLSQAT